jgi:hypothetical protein
VIESIQKGPRTGLIRENLNRTVEERITRMQDAINAIQELSRARDRQNTTGT